MQDNFHKTTFADNPNALVQLSFVGTLALFCLHALSPVVRISISRFGVRPVIILGTILIALSLEMAALATKVNRSCIGSTCVQYFDMTQHDRYGIYTLRKVHCLALE